MGYKTYTCPIARNCGGCEWLAVPYPIQLRRKQEQVESLIGAMAEKDGAPVEPIRGMDEPVHYRHKAATCSTPVTRNPSARAAAHMPIVPVPQ